MKINMGLLLCKDELLEEKVVAQKFLDVSLMFPV